MNSLIRWNRPELSGWPTFGRLTDLRDEIDRLFESPLSEMARSARLFSGWTPALDLYEDKDNLVVKLELPGMKREDIDVSLHEGSLCVSGERKSEEKHREADVYRAERFYGRFQRTVVLPARTDLESVSAAFKNGVLEITLKAPSELVSKKVPISVH